MVDLTVSGLLVYQYKLMTLHLRLFGRHLHIRNLPMQKVSIIVDGFNGVGNLNGRGFLFWKVVVIKGLILARLNAEVTNYFAFLFSFE